jgi:hypothetical protein
MPIRKSGRKWSEFGVQTTTSGSASINIEDGGQNKTITVDDFMSQYPAVGEMLVGGVGVPVLEVAGATNTIRSLESTGGLSISVGPTNNILLGSAIENGSQGGAEVFVDDAATPLVARTFQGGGGISVTQSGEVVTVQGTIEPQPTKRVLVNTLNDFPAPVLNVITLEDDTVYYLGDFIDIGINTFVAGNNTVITSDSSFVAGLTGTASGALFTDLVGGNFSISSVKINTPNSDIFNLSSPTPMTGVFSIDRVQVESCNSIGLVNNFNTVLITIFGVDSTATNGIVLSGSNAIINLDSILVSDFNGTMFDLNGSTATVINIENTTVVSNNPANIVLDGLPNSGNINPGGAGTFRAVNVVGAFTSLGNILPSDVRWDFSTSNIIPDSQNIGLNAMPTNAVETPVLDGLPTLVSGTWTAGALSRFTATAAGRLTYVGSKAEIFLIDATFAVSKAGSGTDEYRIEVFKNGVAVPEISIVRSLVGGGSSAALAISSAVSLNTNDYIELFVTGIGTTDGLVFSSVNLRAQA